MSGFPELREALEAAEVLRQQQHQDAERLRVQADQMRREVKSGSVTDQVSARAKWAHVALLGGLADVLSAAPSTRNNTLNAVAYRQGCIVGAGLSDEAEVRAALTDVAAQVGQGQHEAEQTISSGLEAGKLKPVDVGKLAQFVGNSKPSKFSGQAAARAKAAPEGRATYSMPSFPKGMEKGTDAANALILTSNALGDRLRYIWGVGWHVYDAVRGIWREDDSSLTLASQVAGEVLRAVVGQHVAQLLKAHAKDEELEYAMKWAHYCCNNKGVFNALKAAAGRSEFLTDIAAWDARPDLLNCLNGVLELTTGVLHPHAPEYLMTWQAGAAFDAAARHEYVNQLTELLKRDGRHDFLQRLVGSALYGAAPNETATVLQGEGGTGKGTLVSAVAAMLGDYAGTVGIELLLSNTHGESSTGPKPELLMLRGKRLAVAGEPPKGARFNTGRVKGMTGNDPITARAMRSNIMVEFKPVFKLWIHTNYPINAAYDDTGMQRRLRVIPFNAKPERPFAAFKSTLETAPAARSALLNWALKGFQLWHSSEYELGTSAEIDEATGDYWKEQNPYEKFAAACLIIMENAEIPSPKLKILFEEWAEENGAKMGRSVKMADLYAYLQTLGCKPGRTKTERFWSGVTAVTEVTPQPQLSTNVRAYKDLTGGQAVIGVTAVTRKDDVTLAPPSGEL